MLKRLMIVLVSLMMVAILSGCDTITADADPLLAPPKPEGELYDIRAALEKSVAGDFSFKYPTKGDYRSAIVLKDINADGIDEALAFYSTTNDNVVNMHINLIANTENGWFSVGDVKCVASGIDYVKFVDFDYDGTEEILVGWAVYGTVDKSVGVYSATGGRFTQRLLEGYSACTVTDLDGDKNRELFIISLNTKFQTGTAKLIELNKTGVEEIGSCAVDGMVTSYNEPVISTIPGGRFAVMIDAIKGSGMLTEVLYVESGKLLNASFNPEDSSSDKTYRPTTDPIRDINGDGNYEIPNPAVIADTKSDSTFQKTPWVAFDGKEFTHVLTAIMNYTEGYYISVPTKWENTVTVVSDTVYKTHSVMRIDPETGNSAQEIVRVYAYPTNDAGTGYTMPQGAVELTRNGGNIYYCIIGDYIGAESVTLEEFRHMFGVLR